MRTLSTKADQPKTGARRDLRHERFTAYFSRLFAYACATTGDDESARDVAAAAFTGVFAMPDMRESEFEIALFRAARDLCHNGEYRMRRHNDGLTPRERDVISLVFDGQLAQAQIGELLGIRPEAASMALTRGLSKLRTSLAPETATGGALPSFS